MRSTILSVSLAAAFVAVALAPVVAADQPIPSQYVCAPGTPVTTFECVYLIDYRYGNGDCVTGDPAYTNYNVAGASFGMGAGFYVVSASWACSSYNGASSTSLGAGLSGYDPSTGQSTAAIVYWQGSTTGGETTCRAGVTLYGLEPVPNQPVQEETSVCPPEPATEILP